MIVTLGCSDLASKLVGARFNGDATDRVYWYENDELCMGELTGNMTVVSVDEWIKHYHNYYKQSLSGVECIEVIEHMSFCVGNAMKYLWRQGLKPDNHAVDDLKKAMYYIQREIDRLSGE